MRLTDDEARSRLLGHAHGVLCTVHPRRGPDPQPVCYVVTVDGYVGVPVDRIKPKATGPLQRERNLAADPRAALLVEHWDPVDWSRLWWVRAELRHESSPSSQLEEELAGLLVRAVPQYVDRPFDRLVVCRIGAVTGWAYGRG